MGQSISYMKGYDEDLVNNEVCYSLVRVASYQRYVVLLPGRRCIDILTYFWTRPVPRAAAAMVVT